MRNGGGNDFGVLLLGLGEKKITKELIKYNFAIQNKKQHPIQTVLTLKWRCWSIKRMATTIRKNRNVIGSFVWNHIHPHTVYLLLPKSYVFPMNSSNAVDTARISIQLPKSENQSAHVKSSGIVATAKRTTSSRKNYFLKKRWIVCWNH